MVFGGARETTQNGHTTRMKSSEFDHFDADTGLGAGKVEIEVCGRVVKSGFSKDWNPGFTLSRLSRRHGKDVPWRGCALFLKSID